MMRPDAKVEKVYLYPKPVDFRKSIDGLAGTRFLTSDQLNRKAYADSRLQRYWARCEAIAATPQAIDHETGEVKPPALELDTEAEQDWLEFYNEVEGEQSSLGKFENLRPFAGRAGELVRRLAAVFACFEGQQRIDGECLRRAAVLARYSLNEWARYTDSESVNPDMRDAVAIMEWMQDPKRAANWRTFDKAHAGKSWPQRMRHAKKRDRLLGILAEYGHLLTSDGNQFRINPLAEAAENAERQ